MSRRRERFPHMSLSSKLAKLFRNPLTVLRNRAKRARERLRYGTPDDYNAVEYWRDRHGTYGFDVRGVGDYTKSIEENQAILDRGAVLLRGLIDEAGVDLKSATVLDVGCGTGHYAGVLRHAGVSEYTGVDIVDTLFEGLRTRYPGYRFEQVDASTSPLPGMHDLIIMIDVSQHISNPDKFRYAMDNLRSHLKPGGTIIISAIIGESEERHSFYVVTRTLGTFRSLFNGFRLLGPRSFDGNQMFTLVDTR